MSRKVRRSARKTDYDRATRIRVRLNRILQAQQDMTTQPHHWSPFISIKEVA